MRMQSRLPESRVRIGAAHSSPRDVSVAFSCSLMSCGWLGPLPSALVLCSSSGKGKAMSFGISVSPSRFASATKDCFGTVGFQNTGPVFWNSSSGLKTLLTVLKHLSVLKQSRGVLKCGDVNLSCRGSLRCIHAQKRSKEPSSFASEREACPYETQNPAKQ